MGTQHILDQKSSDNVTVYIKSPHNHSPHSQKELKKLMFCAVMRRKMQSDKAMGFRAVYEEVCEKDPEIKTLVPLKTIINEICRQQPNMKTPQIKSFDEFYETIEEKRFEKLHFTYSNQQFYQEKFASSDGSRAVVFANKESITKYSYSKVMYVDSSFKIETIEDFGYYLVTVLVWVEESVSIFF